jgi:hypothetical protein
MQENGTMEKARVRNVVSRWNKDTGRRQDYERTDAIFPPEKEQQTTFRSVMSREDPNRLLYEEVVVKNDSLRNLLAETISHFPPQQFEDQSVGFRSPFEPFVWQWEKLQEASEPIEGDMENIKSAREDLKLLLSLVQTSENLENYFKNELSFQRGETTTFSYIWSLFPPGTKVYARPFIGYIQMFEIQSSTWTDRQAERDTFVVTCAAFDWDGEHFKSLTYTFEIPKFEGTRSIVDLPCFPVAYYSNDANILNGLIRQGLKFFELCKKTGQYYYEGWFCPLPGDYGGTAGQ